MTDFWAGKRVILTGGAGFLGSGVRRALEARGVAGDRLFVPRSAEYDLTREEACGRLYAEAFGGAPADVVVHVAGTVGGIGATTARPGDFFRDNAAMGLHLIEGFRRAGLIERGARFAMVGTAASYPVDAPMPLSEGSLWRGLPSQAGASYGIAKLAALEMLAAYRAQFGMASSYLVPINVYGPGDHFDPENSHVVAAMVRRFVEAADAGAREVVCWGTGRATRDFLYVDDAAEGGRARRRAVRGAGADQPRDGPGDADRRAGRGGGPGGRVRGRDPVGRRAPGRGAAPGAGHRAGAGAPGLVAGDGPGDGRRADGRVVPRA